MHFWLLTVGEPLPIVDAGNPRLLRTAVLARRLHERGHDVVWWTSTFDHNAKRQRAPNDSAYEWNGVRVQMLNSVGYQTNVSFRRFIEHREVARKFARLAPGLTPPDAILASLPTIELAAAAVKFGRERVIPVLLDVRDLWPDVLFDAVPGALRPLARTALFWLTTECRRALKEASGIIGISDGYLRWGLDLAGRNRIGNDAIFPLGYVAPGQSPDAHGAQESLRSIGVDPARAIVWYVGSFGRQYDLAPVIDAARRFQSEGRTGVQFVISGTGELETAWRARAAGLDNVVFTGWIDADRINWLRSHAAIGLQPYVAGAPQGLANKLFEYLSAGVPVVSSLRGENAALIAAHDCGLNYAAGDAHDCYARVAELLDDPDRRRRMGANGRRLFETQFDGNVVFDGLAGHLESVARSRVRSAA